MRVFVARLSVFMALALGLAAPATAQTELGSITGTLKDPQGAVLPGVTATAVNVNTNVTTTDRHPQAAHRAAERKLEHAEV